MIVPLDKLLGSDSYKLYLDHGRPSNDVETTNAKYGSVDLYLVITRATLVKAYVVILIGTMCKLFPSALTG